MGTGQGYSVFVSRIGRYENHGRILEDTKEAVEQKYCWRRFLFPDLDPGSAIQTAQHVRSQVQRLREQADQRYEDMQ